MSSRPPPSYHAGEPRPPTDLLWDRVPSLKIVRPPKGPHSPQIDERCLTYCSQSVAGRLHQRDPWCRSLCLRRVFAHEVRRVLSLAPSPTIPTGEPLELPLPPEGQRPLFGFNDHRDRLTESGDGGKRTWREGWYLWWTRSRWAAQERLDLMRRDLPAQAEWERTKARRNDDWRRARDAAASSSSSAPLPRPPSKPREIGNAQPYPELSEQSILLPLPPALPLHALLAPTAGVLALVDESVRSGALTELGRRAWDKAKSDEPMKLLGVLSGMVWAQLGFADDDDSEDERRRRKDP